jgi:hypothetical protein
VDKGHGRVDHITRGGLQRTTPCTGQQWQAHAICAKWNER